MHIRPVLEKNKGFMTNQQFLRPLTNDYSLILLFKQTVMRS